MTALWQRLERAAGRASTENAASLVHILDSAKAFAAGLVALGVTSKDRVAIYADDGPDWLAADLGAQRIGCGVIAVPPALASGALSELLERLSPAVLVTRAPHGLSTVTSILGGLRTRTDGEPDPGPAQAGARALRLVVVLAGRDGADRLEQLGGSRPQLARAGDGADGAAAIDALSRALVGHSDASQVVSAEALMQLGSAGHPGPVAADVELIGFSAATGGTLHAAAWSSRAVWAQLERLNLELTQNDVVWSDLGLAHPLGRLVGYRTLLDGARLTLMAGDVRQVVPKVEPSYLLGVPRTFEALFASCAIDAERAGGLPRRLFRWAQSLGDDMSYVYEGRYEPDVVLRIRHRLTRRLVVPRLAVHLGRRLTKAMCATGAVSHDILRFFHGLGVNVGQCYGTLAVSPVTHLVPPSGVRFDGAFPPVDGVDARLENGRLFLSAPELSPAWVTPNAMDRGSSDGSEAPVDTTSYVDTGDLAELREAGVLKRVRRCAGDANGTTGRALASVAELEAELTASPYLSRAYVTGASGPFLCALVTLDTVAVDTFARERGVVVKRASDLARRPEIYALVNSIVASVNASRPAFEAIRKFAVLDSDFAHATGELTPFGGLCRDVVARRHAALIASFYSETY